MNNKLFVAGLDYGINDTMLAELFAPVGTVQSAKVVMDRETGRPRGFGFVEMSTDQEAAEAVRALDGKEVSGRKLVVNIAKPKADGGRPSNDRRY